MSTYKPWPKTGPASFDDITSSLRAAILSAYTLKRKNRSKDIPYDGFDTSPRLRASYPSPINALKAKSLAFDEEDQGRDALDVLIGIAVQVGIEQGERIYREEQARRLNMTLTYVEQVRRDISREMGKPEDQS